MRMLRDVDAANAADLQSTALASDAMRGADDAVVGRSTGSIRNP